MNYGSLESLLNRAKEEEKRYKWLQAAELYQKASTLPLKDKDHVKVIETEELRGYCYFRAALQAKTNKSFRSRIKRSKQTFERNLKALSSSDKAKISHIKAMATFAGSYLELDLLKKRKMLDIWRDLEKEAIKEYEQNGDLFSSGKISNIFVEYSSFDLLHLALNWTDQIEIVEEAISLGEKAIVVFSKLNNDSELARAYCWTSWYYGWAIFQGVNKNREEEFGKKSLEYSEKAIELSEKTGNAWLIGWSNNAASLIHFAYTKNLASALGYCENFQTHGKIAQDNSMLFIGQWWAAMCTSNYAGSLIEDPDKQREGFEKAIKLANEAIMKAKIMAFYLVFLPNTTLSANYLQLALIETSPEIKRSLFEKSLRTARKYYDPKYSISLHYSTVLGNLGNVLFNIARVKKEAVEKSRLLQEALHIKTEEVAFDQEKMPENRFMLDLALYGGSLMHFELVKLEKDREKRVELLEDAASIMEHCVKDISESLEARFSAWTARTVGNCLYWLGKILSQLFIETKEKKIIDQAIKSYDAASKLFNKINLQTHSAECYWNKAILEEQLGVHLEAAASYQAAAKNYENTSLKIPQLREFYKNYSLYIQAWNQIEQARYAHSIEEYAKARQNYERAATLHESTEAWSYLAPNYLAWANMEEAEGLSRKENTQQAKQTFQKALAGFTAAAKSINQKTGEITSPEEKEMNHRLLQASDLRRKYCHARILLEDAKLLDRQGEHLESSKSYEEAAQNILSIIEKVESEAERKEMKYLVTLCQAWEKMAVAEETTSSESYIEAAQLFEHAKEHCYTKKASLWALGNSNFCRGLAAGVEYQTMLNAEDHNKAKGYIQNAATNYFKAGYKHASEYAKATLRLFDAYLFMNQAERESDTEKRVKQYQLAENLLQLASDSFMKAKQLEKTAQVKQILENVREEKKLAISFNEVLQAPSIALTTQSFTAPSPTSEVSVGLEQFQHANVQANLIAGLKEVKVGESFCLTVEFVNAGKEPALLTRVEDFVPPDFIVVKKPEIYRLEESCLNMKGKQIAPLKLVEAKLVLQPSTKGVYQLKPTVHYLDELGQNKTLQLKSVEIKVEEVILSDRISTGTKELDSLLLGGIPEGYAVVLTGSPSDERELLIKNFLREGIQKGQPVFFVSTEADNLENLLNKPDFHLFLCNPKPKTQALDLSNVTKLRSKTDINNLDMALTRESRNLQTQQSPKRLCIEIVSDVLVEYGVKTTRKWISELLTDLCPKGFTILAVLDSGMHTSETANAITYLFDGEISITQSDDQQECKKSLTIKKLRNQDYIKNPICMTT